MRTTIPFALFLLLASLLPAAAAFGQSDDAWQKNWPQWRGPLANGFSATADPPVEWGPDHNIKWKVAVPGQGESTPIVWNDRIFITTAVETDREQEQPPADNPEAPGGNPFRIQRPTHYYQFVVACHDRATGKLVWQQIATEQVPHEGHHKDHGFASPSPVTDGQLLVTSFGSRGVYCWDLEGKQLWKRDLGPLHMYRFFGEASSPALADGTVFLTWDNEGESALYALDARTGQTRWRTEREPHSSWSTPLVVEHAGRKQVIVNSNSKARGYDFDTGRVLWECGGQTRAIIPCPLVYHGRVFLMSGYPEMRLDRRAPGRHGRHHGQRQDRLVAEEGHAVLPVGPVDGRAFVFQQVEHRDPHLPRRPHGRADHRAQASARPEEHLRLARRRRRPHLFHRPRRHDASPGRRPRNQSPSHQQTRRRNRRLAGPGWEGDYFAKQEEFVLRGGVKGG